MPVVKADAIRRADAVDAEMDWPRGLTIGRLTILWDQAQMGKGTSLIKRRHLAIWASVDSSDADRFIEACIKVHFLEPRDDGFVFIVGNDRQVKRIDEFIQRQSDAGRASAEARRAKAATNQKPTKPPTAVPTGNPTTVPTNGSTDGSTKTQPFSFSSSFSSSSSPGSNEPVPEGSDRPRPEPVIPEVVYEPVEPARKAKKPKTPTDGSLVWESYRQAYLGRYGQEPVRNTKSNSICAQLVDRLGAADAIKVAAFYLGHHKAWYVQGLHPLDSCLKDCEALRTQMLNGRMVTAAQSNRTDKTATNIQSFASIAARIEQASIGPADDLGKSPPPLLEATLSKPTDEEDPNDW